LNFQFQNIKFQFLEIQGQFEKIEMQIKNMLNPNISSQIINLGINLINTGIQTLLMGILIPDMTRNNINIKSKIDDLIIQMNNISMQINNMNFQMGFLNYGNNLLNNNNEWEPKININFTTEVGQKYNLAFNYGSTIDEILEQYLIKTNSLQLRNELNFLYNTTPIKFGDNRKIEDAFRLHLPHVPIIVFRTNSGAPIKESYS